MRSWFIICLSVICWGCGTKSEENNSDGTVDAGPDVSAIDMAPAVMCPIEGYLFCGEKCIDVSFDLDHCGTCGNSCTRGTMSCMTGECVCLGDGIMCDGECFDTFKSREHCGGCGASCTSAEVCLEGGCIPIADDPRVFGVLVSTNEGRAEQQDCGVHGLKAAVGPVVLNDLLNTAAQGHAEDMAANQFLEHDGSDGSTPFERAARAGYAGRLIGENVARGQNTAPDVVAGWIASDGHCNNLMNGNFSEMGVGYAENPTTGRPYWAQLFGAP